jgi:hypothetical protein
MSKSSTPTLHRRAVFAGAGAAGALAAAAVVLPGSAKAPAQAAATLPESGEGTGYRLTEHVKRYYATARV